MNRELLVRYLLNELPEPDRASVEERLFFDETLFAELMDLETSLERAQSRRPAVRPGKTSGWCSDFTRRERDLMELNLLAAREERLHTSFALALLTATEPPEPCSSHIGPPRVWYWRATLAAAAGAAVWLTFRHWPI